MENNKGKLATLKFTQQEMSILSIILGHVVDGMYNDNRIDHGFNALKEIQNLSSESKTKIALLCSRIIRLYRHKKW